MGLPLAVIWYKRHLRYVWHILLARDMKKKDLEEKSELSHYTLIKMSRDENVTTEVLGKI